MSINRQNTHIIPTRFEYHAPTSLDEAIELLTEYGGDARLLAGGTDLLVKMKQRVVEPRHLINLKMITGLTGIEEKADGIHIGAATKLRAIERSPLIREKLPLLHEAVRAIGSVQIRNMATLGGNLCNASPAADSAIALIALDARVQVKGAEGDRVIPLDGFFVGPGKTVLSPSEVLVEIVVPPQGRSSGACFIKIGRTSLDLAMVSIAAAVTLGDEAVEDCRIALGAVAPTPIRVREVEAFLRGKRLTDEVLEEVAAMVSAAIRPITDVRATAEYRRTAAEMLTKDALTRVAEEARRRRG